MLSIHNVPYVLQCIRDIFPHGKAGPNSDSCPSKSFVRISHLLYDPNLVSK